MGQVITRIKDHSSILEEKNSNNHNGVNAQFTIKSLRFALFSADFIFDFGKTY